jgi:hypothetical protein
MKNEQQLWITWETQRRNKELAKPFNAILKVFDNSNLNSFKRYFKSTIQTIQAINLKPKVVFAQCPSLVLCLELAILKPIFRYKLIIDCHNAVIDYLYYKGPLISFLMKRILSTADYIILSNEGLISKIPIDTNKILILPDKLPTISISQEKPKILDKEKLNITFICSFAYDEPILEFLEAAKKLTSQCKFFITGKKKNALGYLNYQNESIVFTDYLSEQKFEALIAHSDINIDLTTKDNLLVCGAYETLAVNVPGIISDTEIQRTTFPKGYVYTNCTREDIYEKILYSIENLNKLKSDLLSCKLNFETAWNNAFKLCLTKIDNQ